MRWKDPNLPGRVSGIVETEGGDLWIDRILRSNPCSCRRASEMDPRHQLSGFSEHFDALDGLPGHSAYRVPEPSIVESSKGRLWFATTKGIAWLDPVTLEHNRNRLPPPVTISSIIANNKTYPGWKVIALPAHTENLQIDYTALSLAIPERVKFRYQLEGIDKGWQDPGTRRQAFYTNLTPKTYRFRVIACNNDGVWNEQGASLQFQIRPAYIDPLRLSCFLAPSASS